LLLLPNKEELTSRVSWLTCEAEEELAALAVATEAADAANARQLKLLRW
jgi:hypothetical protein